MKKRSYIKKEDRLRKVVLVGHTQTSSAFCYPYLLSEDNQFFFLDRRTRWEGAVSKGDLVIMECVGKPKPNIENNMWRIVKV
jgi:hypothetical protein